MTFEKPTNDYEAFVLALELSASAPTEEKRKQCIEMADGFASKICDLEYSTGRREALVKWHEKKGKRGIKKFNDTRREELEEWVRGHGSPYDRGGADSYYQRPFSPHYLEWVDGKPRKVLPKDMTNFEINEYHKGYMENEKLGHKKEY